MWIVIALFIGLLIAGYKMDELEGRHVWIYLGWAVGLNAIAFIVGLVANQLTWFVYGGIVAFILLDIILLFVVFGEYLSNIRS